MMLLFLLILLAGIVSIIIGIAKKKDEFIFIGIALIIIFAIAFYMLGEALSGM